MRDVTRKIVFTVAEDEVMAGYYTVSTYVIGDPGTTSQTDMYRKLSWCEAVDVMLTVFDENRPGAIPDEEGKQFPLW